MATNSSAKRRRDKRSLARIARAADTFDFDPSTPISSKTMAWLVVKRRLLTAVNRNPCASQPLLERARSYFDARRCASRTIEQHRLYNCLFVTTLCLEATARREQDDSEGAFRLLDRARRESGRCPQCLAEIDRHVGLVHFSQGDAERASAMIRSATERYLAIGHDGHNLNDNAPASCLFAASAISWMQGRFDEAIEQIYQVVGRLDPERSPELFNTSQLAVAKYLFDAGDESRFPEALQCLDRVAPDFYRISKPMAPKAHLEWNRGMIRGRLGEARAESHLESARSQFIRVGNRRNAVMVTSDMTHLCLLRNRPARLIEPSVAEARVVEARVPWQRWVPETARVPFRRLLRCLRSGHRPAIWEACVDLRQLSSVNQDAMPSLLPALRFIG